MSDDLFTPTVAADAASLRRALRGVIGEAQAAIDRLDSGQRPNNSITGSLLPSVSDCNRLAARLDLLLNWAGSPFMTNESAIAALRGDK